MSGFNRQLSLEMLPHAALSSANTINATPFVSPAIDTFGYRRAAVLIVAAITGAGESVVVSVTESATSGGTYTAVPVDPGQAGNPNTLLTTPAYPALTSVEAAADASKGVLAIYEINLQKRLRFLKLSALAAGGTYTGGVTAIVILMDPIYAPPAQDNATVANTVLFL